MMARTIASLLTDFSPPAGKEALGLGVLRPVKPAEEVVPEAPRLVVDRQAELIKAAEAKVRSEEREAALKKLDEAIASEKVRYEEELSVQREIWVEQQAAQLSAQIVEAMTRIEENLSDRVANTLRPFISEAFRQQSVAEFREVIATLLFRGETRLMKISGPEDLLKALRANLASHEGGVEFFTGDHVEVSLATQDTIVQTQLESWAARLEQALKAE
jgi:hypothetical protein